MGSKRRADATNKLESESTSKKYKHSQPTRAKQPQPHPDSNSDDNHSDYYHSEDGDDFIGDDGQDLMAGLEHTQDYTDDDEGDDEGDDSRESEAEQVSDHASMGAASPPPQPQLQQETKKKAPKPANLSPDELRALAFAQLTAAPVSSIFSTKVAALLPTLSHPPAETSPIQPLVQSLAQRLVSLSSASQAHDKKKSNSSWKKATSLAQLRKRGVVVPPVQGSEQKWDELELSWAPPASVEDVQLVGNWAWDAATRNSKTGEYIVQVAIAIPSTLLQPKDYLSPRFALKTTHYLTTLASILPSDVLGPTTLAYTPHSTQGYSLDIRSLAPTAGAEKIGLQKTKGAVLRLVVVAPSTVFPHNKISPSSNLSRPSTTITSTSTSPTLLPATPIRSSALNLSLLPTLVSHANLHVFLASSHSNKAFTTAIRLIQLWASGFEKRGFHTSLLGVTGDNWWTWCVARAVVGTAPLRSAAGFAGVGVGGSDAWVLWRKTLEFLAGAKWVGDGVGFNTGKKGRGKKAIFEEEGEESIKPYEREEFRKAFEGKPLFIDPTGTVNLAAGIELSTLEMLRHEARVTMALLVSDASDELKFAGALVKPLRDAERFDNYIRVVIPPSVLAATSSTTSPLDHETPISAFIAGVCSSLRRALGNRVKAFHVRPPPHSTSIPAQGSAASSSTDGTVLAIGLILDAAEAGRLVDQGPSAEDEAACAEFRTFWGPKSELRRFKDGSIVESVVWDDPADSLDHKAYGLGQHRSAIAGRIVRYILETRHAVPKDCVTVFAGSMDHLLVEPEAVRRAIYLQDPVQSGRGFATVVEAYDALARDLTGLADLPLTVSAVQPSSSGLRYSSILTPSPRRLKNFERFPNSTKFIDVHDVVVTLEGSGRWPDDLEGIQKIKAAFLSKIGEGLSQLHTIIAATISFDTDARPIDDNVSLEVLTASGFAFRVRISYERSIALLELREANVGVPPLTSPTDSPLQLYNQRFVHTPRHHAAISTLQHHYSAYSTTVRLFKRWLSAHMVSSSFPDALAELVCASVFLDPASTFDPPASGAAGFARTIAFLANWKWKDEPLHVALYTFYNATTSGRRPAFPHPAKEKSKAAFEARRLADPTVNSFAWIVCTEEDQEGHAWGRSVNKIVASRVRSLAKATIVAFENQLVSDKVLVENLFTTPLTDYSFLIHIDPSVNPRHFENLNPDSSALSSRSHGSVVAGNVMGHDDDSTILLGWDPVSEFIREAEALYPSTFLLFYSQEGGSTIGGIWNPSTESARPWKIGLGFPCAPVTDEDKADKTKVSLDKAATLRALERLGKGLVIKVEQISHQS
ncbi:Nrap protein [Meredithblackwellia eburnea MCA 4105]